MIAEVSKVQGTAIISGLAASTQKRVFLGGAKVRATLNGIVKAVEAAHAQMLKKITTKLVLTHSTVPDASAQRSPHAYNANPSKERSLYKCSDHNCDDSGCND